MNKKLFREFKNVRNNWQQARIHTLFIKKINQTAFFTSQAFSNLNLVKLSSGSLKKRA